MTEMNGCVERLTSLTIHVDRAGRIHALTDGAATWKFMPSIAAGDLVKTYTELVAAPWTGLTSLTIHVDRAGRIQSRSDVGDVDAI